MDRKKADRARGIRLRKKLNGSRWGTTSPAIAAMAPDLEDMVNEVVFGRIWSRPGLDLRMRCVAVISALTARQQLPQLKNYILNGLAGGLTREEIVEIMMQLVFYVGLPSVASALQVVQDAFEEAP
jgi:4-carboxymuconolactone decarboxylase